jgi:hypothetical protein
MAVLDHLQAGGENVLLIDSDTSNPDVWKAYHEVVQSELVNLDEADGWIQLVNLCDEHRDSTVVLNTAARNNQGVSAYGVMLHNTLAELESQLVTLWANNRSRSGPTLHTALRMKRTKLEADLRGARAGRPG